MRKTFLSLSVALTVALGAQAQDVATFKDNLNFPTGIARDQQGFTYIAERGNNRILKVDLDGNATVYCDQGLTLPVGLCFDTQGNLYVANYTGQTIGKIPPGGGPATVHASGFTSTDVFTVRHYDSDTLLVQGYNNNTVYKVFPEGGVAGSATVPVLIPTTGMYGGGIGVYANKDILVAGFPSGGSYAELNRFDRATGTTSPLATPAVYLGVDLSPMFGNNQFYMAANFGHRIYQIDGNTGNATVVAGSGVAGYLDGPAMDAELWFPYCTYADELGNLWFSEQGSYKVRKMVTACAAYSVQANATGPFCVGSDITLTGSYSSLTGYPAAAVESWQSDDFNIDENGGVVQFSPDAQLYYGVATYRLRDVVGCVFQSNVSITVTDPAITFAVPAVGVCEGQSVEITADGGFIEDFTWAPSSAVHTTNGPTLNVTPTEDETFTIYGTDANGCEAEASITVTVNPYPEVSILEGSELSICEGGSATLTGQGASFYTWGPAEGLSALSGQSVTASPEETTIYTVYGSTNGCTTEDTITLNVEVCVGIEEAGLNNLDIYPNPTADMLTIRFADARVRNIAVLDGAGRTVMDFSASSASTTLDLSPLAPGIYAITVLDGANVSRSKVVRQ
jgi:hypothetical protein